MVENIIIIIILSQNVSRGQNLGKSFCMDKKSILIVSAWLVEKILLYFCLLLFAAFLKEKPFSIRRDGLSASSRNGGLAVYMTFLCVCTSANQNEESEFNIVVILFRNCFKLSFVVFFFIYKSGFKAGGVLVICWTFLITLHI